jgi:hypothetical protein
MYNDTDVRNEVTYYYKLAAVDELGAINDFTYYASCTPKEDVEPPEGGVIINNGEKETYSSKVTLTFSATSDTEEIMLSNEPTFKDSIWEPYTGIKQWTLGSDKGTQTVYVKFRDSSGNYVSDAAHDSILVSTPLNVRLSVEALNANVIDCTVNGQKYTITKQPMEMTFPLNQECTFTFPETAWQEKESRAIFNRINVTTRIGSVIYPLREAKIRL